MILTFSWLIESIFIGFGFYSIFYSLSSKRLSFWQKPFSKRFDSLSFLLFSLAGFLSFYSWFYELNQTVSALSEDGLYERIFGPNWLFYWIHPVIYMSLSQLFWIKKWRKNIFLRIGIGLILIIGIERVIQVVLSYHRDYLPSSWLIFHGDILSNWILSIFSFVALVLVFQMMMSIFQQPRSLK